MHDVLPCNEALAAERVDNFMKQGPLDGDVLRLGGLEQHRVQDRGAGEQAAREETLQAGDEQCGHVIHY